VCPRKQHTGTRLRFDQQIQNLLAIITNNIVFTNNQRNHGRHQNIIFSPQKSFNATSPLKVPLAHCSGGGGGSVETSPVTILPPPPRKKNFYATAAVCGDQLINKDFDILSMTREFGLRSITLDRYP